MGAVSSAFIWAAFSSVHILSLQFTNENFLKLWQTEKALHNRSLNFPSTVDQNYRLLKVGYVNQVIQSLSYKIKNLKDKQVQTSVVWKVLIKKFSRSSVDETDLMSRKGMTVELFLLYSLLIVFTLGPYLAQRKKKGN